MLISDKLFSVGGTIQGSTMIMHARLGELRRTQGSPVSHVFKDRLVTVCLRGGVGLELSRP